MVYSSGGKYFIIDVSLIPLSPRSRRTLIMFLSPNGLMVVSKVKMSQELKYERLTSLFLVVFSEIDIL